MHVLHMWPFRPAVLRNFLLQKYDDMAEISMTKMQVFLNHAFLERIGRFYSNFALFLNSYGPKNSPLS